MKVLVHGSKWHGTTIDLAGQHNICSPQELTSPLGHREQPIMPAQF